jgi:hypothetical protein
LAVSGTSNLGADITTSGTQTYTGAVTLSGDDRTLTGTTINNVSTISGGNNSLTITGNADVDGAITGVTNLSISGTSNLGANVITSGTQTYTGAVTLSGGDRTLTGSTINNVSTINGGSNSLTITGNADLNGDITDVINMTVSGEYNQVGNITVQTLSVTGGINLNGSISILSTQPWVINNQITLRGNSSFITTNTDIEFVNRILGSGHNLRVSSRSGSIKVNGLGLSNAFLGNVILNSSGVTELNGDIYAASIETDSNGTGAGSVLINSTFVQTSGNQTYRELTTIANNTTIRSSTLNIFQNMVAQGNLVLNAGATGANQTVANLGNINITGTLTLLGTLNASAITVGGDVMLNGTIRTTGDQVWTSPNSIILTGNSSLIAGKNSTNAVAAISDLNIGRRIYSATGSGNHNLNLEATGDVIIANDIGSAPGVTRLINASIDNNGLINELRVNAGNNIDLFADITTKNLQDYTATSINIGSVVGTSIHNQVNWNLSGTTGYSDFDPAYVKENNASLVRTLISVDPTIKFNGAVNDQIEGTHSLVTVAIARDRVQDAEVIFGSTIGAERKLYSVSARTLEYLEGAQAPSVRGTVKLGGGVSTVANQTYEADIFEILGNAAITLSSDSGKIRVLADSYTMTVGMLSLIHI